MEQLFPSWPWMLAGLLAYPASLLVFFFTIKLTKLWRMSGVARAVLQAPLIMLLGFGCVFSMFALIVLFKFNSQLAKMPDATGIALMAFQTVLIVIIPILLYRQLRKQDKTPKDPPPFPILAAILEGIGLLIGLLILLFVAASYVLRPIGISIDQITTMPLLGQIGLICLLIASFFYGLLAFVRLFSTGSPYLTKAVNGLTPEHRKQMVIGTAVLIIVGSILVIASKLT